MASQGDPLFNPFLQGILEEYPRMRGYPWAVQWGEPQQGRQLEFYHPDEPTNPNPGQPTVEVYNRDLKGENLKRAISGDMMHYLPSVDPSYEGMRQEFKTTFTPEQDEVNERAYQRGVDERGEARTYDQWMERSRLDAWLRGGTIPLIGGEWERNRDKAFTGEQKGLLSRMNDYLTGTPSRRY